MIAFLREVSPHLERGELTYLPRKPIEIERARKQHEAYVAILREFGARIEFFRSVPQQPEGVFVEDTAVLLPEVAIITRPGAPSRLGEIETVAPMLAQFRPVQRIAGAGKLDGGDVFRVGRTLYVGQARRTDSDGIAGLREIVEVFDYEVRTVEIRDCLHLKTACTFVPPHFLVANPAWVTPDAFGNLIVIPVDETEPFAANTLTLAGTTLVSASFPKTERRLREAGIVTRRVEISEFEKAEGGLTCLSLIQEPRSGKASGDLALRAIETAEAPAPAGHWSQAIVHGGLVYVSAQPPFRAATSRAQRMSVEEQTERSLRNLAAILASAGSSLSCVLRATIYLADPKHLERIESVYARVFDGHRPVRAVVANPALPPGVAVAIEVVAVITDESA